MKPRWVSLVLVAVQIALLIFLVFSGPWPVNGWPALLAISGGLLALWALAAMHHSKFSILPDVRPGASLVNRGPYRWIRHPMYTSLLLVGLGVVWNHPSPVQWVALLLLLADLLAKLHYEERLLSAVFPDYPAYQAQTKRLVPHIY